MRLNSAVFEVSAALPSQFPKPTLPEIVFSGRSNVGKSSLINSILNNKSLAKISSTPGKTRTINFYNLGSLRLVDLPGYGYAKVPQSEKERWAELITAYFESERDLRLVAQLVDIRHPATRDDIRMIEYMVEFEFPFIIVLTKADKLKKSALAQRISEFNQQFSEYEGINLIPVSAQTGEGIGELRNILISVVQD
ncbi:MAG TPA: ribosome biogenesis GTP-binding protein YihA/YsxC [Candidatus Avimonas sp.]|jgi:GTP-binding protein|nr:YihA family ribosome biogenesis GTP-binding protein [Clostridiales bacterium]HOB35969.1 ribosome biogenesis GTP-binding protein YihA/YsxC [Candidatus Avimonas sp.]HQA15860.1 ribosome biogenesis GTP-binding protein YihA/YsxC [Candidatus Avimonas sp.]HQD37405.1 ribosome biogenesis GTP-binding protein YihA/YsxC [Candidatus Avimonas sp.]